MQLVSSIGDCKTGQKAAPEQPPAFAGLPWALREQQPNCQAWNRGTNSAFERVSTCSPKADLKVTIVYEFTPRCLTALLHLKNATR